jgi:glutathione-specific gamma-glutamylcyclotransferase
LSSLSLFHTMSTGRSSSSSSSSCTHHQAARIDTEEREFDATANVDQNADDTNQPRPYWDPVAQIYVGGVIPDENSEQVRAMIQRDEGAVLRLFGYGSLCWNPGTGVLANAARVTSQPGRCTGYRRCWAQKSTDHRGLPRFPGIVCTLLTNQEVQNIRRNVITDPAPGTAVLDDVEHAASDEIWTEGLLYEIPRDLVDECLVELDFREKGGYARDIITVMEDATGDTHPALLYRGTRDNPAIWPRALVDLPYAAAVMSVAAGPSGHNHVYLHQLDAFLTAAKSISNMQNTSTASPLEKFDDTVRLARMVERFQEKNQLYFLFGCGSNQHNQLLLDLPHGNHINNDIGRTATIRNYAQLLHGQEDAHEVMEIILCTDKQQHVNQDDARAKRIFAGGGHGALLTQGGCLFLFGWNDSGQCGCVQADRLDDGNDDDGESSPLPTTRALQGVPGGIETCALGFNHTIVVERGTGRVYAFGNNRHGQVDGSPTSSCKQFETPTTPVFLEGDFVIDVACGLFHSAAVTRDGQVVVWGGNAVNASRWPPPDNGNARFIRVSCGRKYTVLLDNMGRVWTIGNDNKYGQLGRQTAAHAKDTGKQQPQLVHGPWENDKVLVSELSCGWSHTVVLAKRKLDKNVPTSDDDDDDSYTVVYGWGRNDKGQLGTGTTENVHTPIRLFGSFQNGPQQQQNDRQKPFSIQSISCGSEFTVVLAEERDSNPNNNKDGRSNGQQQLWACGWNEHGNLGIGKHDHPHHQEQQQQQRQGDATMHLNLDSVLQLTRMVGAPVANPPGYPENAPISVATGGAHVLATRSVGVP